MQQNRFGTGEDEKIERDENVRCKVVEIPLLIDLCLAMRIREDHRGLSDFETVIYHPAFIFAIPGPKQNM